MNGDQTGYVCPICSKREITDDRMGHHLVASHWEEISEAFGDEQ